MLGLPAVLGLSDDTNIAPGRWRLFSGASTRAKRSSKEKSVLGLPAVLGLSDDTNIAPVAEL